MLSNHATLLSRSALVLAALAAAGGIAPAALAQPIEEIVVTVRGRAESLQNVPASVQVFTQDQIERSGIERAEDFIYLTPGVSIVDAAEVADTQVNIRGINGARDAENSFALIIDGVLMTNPAALNREYTNLQQIEILKGPQGALYGRNAAAGAIIIKTQEPGEELGGSVKASVAEDSTYLVAGQVGGGLGGNLRWSLGADYRDSDGYYENVIDRLGPLDFAAPGGDTVDNFENWNVNGRLIWEPNDRLKVDSKLRYGEVDAAAITFNASFALPNFVNATPGLTIPEWYENVSDHDFYFQPNIDPQNDQEATEFSVKVDYDLGWADVTAWGLYSDVDNQFGSDGTSAAFQFFAGDELCQQSNAELFAISSANPDLYPPNSFSVLPPPQFQGPTPTFPDGVYGPYLPSTCDGTQWQERNQKDYSFEVRLSSKADQRLRWQAGVYYLNIDREVGVNLGIDTGNGLNPNLFVPRADLGGGAFASNNPTEQLVWDQFDTDVYAVFGNIAYDLTDTIEVALALRWDREEREVDNLVPTPDVATTRYINFQTSGAGTNNGGSPLNPGLDPLIVGAENLAPDGSIPSKSEDFDELQPKVSVNWAISDTLDAFASWGVGFKSGGFNNQGSAATIDAFINCPLAIGSFAGETLGGVTCGLGLITDENAGLPEVNISDQFDKETSSAFEVGLRSNFLDGRLDIEGAYYHTDVDDMQFFEFFVGSFGLLRVVSNIDEVTIDGFELAARFAATDWLSVYAAGSWIDSEIDKNSARPDTVGNESPYTPESTYNLGGTLTLPVTSSMDFVANLDWSFVGETWFHVIQENQRPTVFAPVAGFVLGLPGDVANALATANWDRSQRDSYDVLNLRIGLQTERWGVTAWATNITDEEYLEEVIPAPEFGGSFIHPGTERRLGVEATYRF